MMLPTTVNLSKVFGRSFRVQDVPKSDSTPVGAEDLLKVGYTCLLKKESQ